ncbi:hypothetical protein ACOMHN_061640 [Nucella lapillus]
MDNTSLNTVQFMCDNMSQNTLHPMSDNMSHNTLHPTSDNMSQNTLHPTSDKTSGSLNRSNSCQRCAAVFMLPRSLTVHMQAVHGQTADSHTPAASKRHNIISAGAKQTGSNLGRCSPQATDDHIDDFMMSADHFAIKLEPPWSMKEEPHDEPSAVYSTVQPMSDNTAGLLLTLYASHVCHHCFDTFVLFSSLELHLATFHGETLHDLLSTNCADKCYSVGYHHADRNENVGNCNNKRAVKGRKEKVEGGDSNKTDQGDMWITLRHRGTCGSGGHVDHSMAQGDMWITLRHRRTCGPGGHVDQGDMWTRGTCGPGGHVDQGDMWIRRTCGSGGHVDQEDMWIRRTCGSGGHVDHSKAQGDMWIRRTCGSGGHVDQENMWIRRTCGSGGHVDQEDMWTRGTCGPGGHVDQGDMWTRRTCGFVFCLVLAGTTFNKILC